MDATARDACGNADVTGPRAELAAARLRVAKCRSGLTFDEVARLSGLAPNTVRRMMQRDTSIPSGYSLMCICPVLHVSADWVLGIPPVAPGPPPASAFDVAEDVTPPSHK